MHIQPIDSTQDMEPFVVAMVPEEQQRRDNAAEAGETFDDVWGSEPSSPAAAPAREPAPSRSAHPSDVPRLRAEHTTAGYREGVTAAKATSIQDGFDEGFSVGAALGAKAGQLIGVLEGITRALDGHSDADSKAARNKMLLEATEQLRVEGLFTPDYWNTDGTWKYDVKVPQDSHQSERQVLFADVADAHPIIARWTKIVDDEIERWAIDRHVFADVGDEGRQIVQEKPPAPSVPQTKKPLDW